MANYFRIPGCRSNGGEHAIEISKALAQIVKLDLGYVIKREPMLKSASLRPDSVILLKKSDKYLCVILEICCAETDSYLSMKINTLRGGETIKEDLSELVGVTVHDFDIVVKGKDMDGTFEFNQYLELIKEETE